MTARTVRYSGYRVSDAKLRAELAAVCAARAAERVIVCDVYMLDGTCREWVKVGEAVLRVRRKDE